ncbi:high-affinity choline transporter 1-like [Polypterus senegalus]|uniref:high-affinity choline transporter 1-like n=1 Tax=Polypterus senegalus TaxID=55291 RepID=UPI001962D6F9|nr:high-affinity choline transporter 1-like [Polypterus senegalus]XP_039600062.1 high-affinity choline transporter 1-like [Polypterus senegalus]
MALHIPGLVAVVVFYAVILITGIWAAKISKKEEKKYVGERSEVSMLGGRNLGIWLGIFTTTATWVGGGYILGTAELVYLPSKGLLWATGPVGYTISLILGGFFFAGPMRAKKYVTVIDPFQKKFGNIVSSILVLPLVMSDIFWAACILGALGGTMKVILDIKSLYSILLSSIVAICYTLLGGLYSVVYTDVIQLIFIFFTLWLCIPFFLINPAVTNIWYTATHEVYQAPWIGFLELEDAGIWLDEFFVTCLGGLCCQPFYQRVLASSSVKHAKIMCLVSGIFCLSLGIPPMLIGAMAASTDWNQTSHGLPTPFHKGEGKNILPLMLEHLCPTYVSIIGIGAVAAAVMSSVDSALLSSSSMFASNIYKNIIRKKASDQEVLWAIRAAILVFGIIAMSLAMASSSIYELWFLSLDLLFSLVFAQLVCVLFIPVSNGYGAIAGLIMQLTMRLGGGDSALHIPPFICYPGCSIKHNSYVQSFPFKTLSVVVTFLTIVIVSSLASLLFHRGLLPVRWDICNLQINSRNRNQEEPAEEICLGNS